MLLFSAVYCNTKIWLLNCINNLFKELQNSTFTSHHMALNQTREKFILSVNLSMLLFMQTVKVFIFSFITGIWRRGEEGFMGDKGQRKSNKWELNLQPRLLMLTAGPSGPIFHTRTHRPKHARWSLRLLAATGKQSTQHEREEDRERGT